MPRRPQERLARHSQKQSMYARFCANHPDMSALHASRQMAQPRLRSAQTVRDVPIRQFHIDPILFLLLLTHYRLEPGTADAHYNSSNFGRIHVYPCTHCRGARDRVTRSMMLLYVQVGDRNYAPLTTLERLVEVEISKFLWKRCGVNPLVQVQAWNPSTPSVSLRVVP